MSKRKFSYIYQIIIHISYIHINIHIKWLTSIPFNNRLLLNVFSSKGEVFNHFICANHQVLQWKGAKTIAKFCTKIVAQEFQITLNMF